MITVKSKKLFKIISLLFILFIIFLGEMNANLFLYKEFNELFHHSFILYDFSRAIFNLSYLFIGYFVFNDFLKDKVSNRIVRILAIIFIIFTLDFAVCFLCDLISFPNKYHVIRILPKTILNNIFQNVKLLIGYTAINNFNHFALCLSLFFPSLKVSLLYFIENFIEFLLYLSYFIFPLELLFFIILAKDNGKKKAVSINEVDSSDRKEVNKMAFCRNCGKEIPEEAVICVHCGVPVKKDSILSDEPASTGLKVICFLLPIVGLIEYLIYIDKSPLKSKECGKYALIGFIVGIILWVIVYASLLNTSYYY